MAFFPEQEPKLDRECLAWAMRLHIVIKKMGRVRKWSNITWTKIFAQLKKKHSTELVEQCVAWYEKNAGKEFVPVCASAAAFYKKFLNIKAAMDRSQAEEITVVADQNDIDMAEAMINSFGFPVEIVAHLPQIIHKTKENWRVFLKRLQDFKIRSFSATSREFAFLNHIQAHTVLFPAAWIEFLGRVYGRFQNYTGKIGNLVFVPESEHFKHSFWHQWSYGWCGNANQFDYLLERIIKVNSRD